MTASVVTVESEEDAAAWDDRASVLACLHETPPRIPAWYGYDAVGADIWVELSRLPSYYLLQAEFDLLERHADEIADRVGPYVTELGSGSAAKTRLLLGACQRRRPTTYLPIDVTREMLERSAASLPAELDGLVVEGLWGRYEAALAHLREHRPGPLTVVWLGSAVGNTTTAERAALLDDVAATLEPRDRFLVTADLVKPGDVLEAAYNDPPGATAQARFRLNQLAHFNRTFDGDAVPHLFYPRARWDPETSTVVGHLFATEDQRVTFRGLEHALDLRRGDSLVHGYSVKFGRPEFVAEADAAGFDLDREYIDPVWQYGLFLFERR
ncbi:L-histidine N(alpha)-methyltransferase [Actinomycetospora cinnamomea]|uniref:L-histidine N-alpha-methyltransferase n=1 Tax=Actinomycetospora cinnamomea TaxID=663609 RepID=A0A2U1EZT3_9PSEU|nr:L-histidine N(alpha)-methyltransferase [Actinomycetospora cinnamomea]PVZ05421.1 L-histidine N-alpha-methyltransferase [Actinomycetospora cinnamomea]